MHTGHSNAETWLGLDELWNSHNKPSRIHSETQTLSCDNRNCRAKRRCCKILRRHSLHANDDDRDTHRSRLTAINIWANWSTKSFSCKEDFILSCSDGAGEVANNSSPASGAHCSAQRTCSEDNITSHHKITTAHRLPTWEHKQTPVLYCSDMGNHYGVSWAEYRRCEVEKHT